MKIQTTKIFKILSTARANRTRVVSLQGGSRSGKTYNIVFWLIMYALQNERVTISIVRQSLPSLKRSVYRDFREWMEKLNLYKEADMNRTELVYTFPNGSVIEFFSADGQKMRGSKRHILFVNEGNELILEEWTQGLMRTSQMGIIDYNPSFSEEHWLNTLNAADDTQHVITTYKDNPFLEQPIIDTIEGLKNVNKALYDIYALGIRAMVEGRIYKEYSIIDTIPDYVRERYIGIDFGFSNDPTAIVEVAVDGYNLYLDERCYKTAMLSPDIQEELRGERLEVISESADARLVEEIYQSGVNIYPAKKGAGSIEAGILKLLGYRWFITSRSKNLKKEIENYTYKQDKDGRWLNEPIDKYNHLLDAVRYVGLERLMDRYEIDWKEQAERLRERAGLK